MLCVEDLLKLEPFQALPQQRLHWVCERTQAIALAQGEILVREGSPPKGFFILNSGQMGLTRLSDGIEMPIGQQDAPGFLGEVNALSDEPMLVTMKALTECHLYQLSIEDFLTLMHECRNFERSIFQVVSRRLRGLESFLRTREKMAALGTLAAGLAHELNNPAAALIRALKDVIPAMQELERMNVTYGRRQADETDTQRWVSTREEGFKYILTQRLDSLTLSDREDELLDWLEAYGSDQAWKIAGPLAAAGMDTNTLETLTAPWQNDPTELKDLGLRWLALSFEVMSMIQGGLRSAERIGELVRSMKSYSYLDQGVQQIVDVHIGIEDTLRLFAYKLKQGVEVRRSYDRTLPQICAYGSELNQVWTNLIDNAIDAMNGRGTLEIITSRQGDFAAVQIIDSGPGIPSEIQSRIYEPFFTTKQVGQGTGLGLDVARRIVENRHHGTISLDSRPGKTCFMVCLPLPSVSVPPAIS